ncbi:MAG: hypothetical protein LC713_01280 [Actinobacteria bacterium]|nr:hypothetical protein [Actinomycetota bacterium]
MAACLLLAGPAGADPTSVGPNAANNSTSSGAGVAINDSTASGDSVAINGSVSSGCSVAVNDSTASGGLCHPAPAPTPTPSVTPAASVATPVAAQNLAFTGTSTTGPLALAAAALVALGSVLVMGARRRPSPTL